MTSILGLSAFYHDSAACIVVDGEIVAATQEERFTREKYDAAFPSQSVAYCLKEAGLSIDRLDYVAFYERPLVKFDRLLETYLAYAPEGFRSFRLAMPVWLKKKLFIRRTIQKELPGLRAPVLFLDHHESHAASAFFASPYDDAAILTLDGVGEWCTASYGSGTGNKLTLTHELRFPHSLGLLYSALTYYCGFKVNSGEYKLMGLAPYGKPVYQDVILKEVVDLKPNGSLWLNMKYFNYCQGLTMTAPPLHALLGGPPRRPESTLEQRHMDLAASVQRITEESVLRMGRHLHEATGRKNLVMAGGVALNCVANGRLLREGPFENVWVQPAAGDAGGALGAALFVWHQLLEKPRHTGSHDSQKASWLGPKYSSDEIVTVLDSKNAAYERHACETALLERVSDLLAEGKVVGWFHGRAEFGPRALGARSILGDARQVEMQARINLKIKFRESFRPFAPVVLREHVHEWFEMRPGEESPYMLMVAPVRDDRRRHLSADEQSLLDRDPDLVRRVNIPRSSVPAITHVDCSARVQTIDERHGRFHRLLTRFHEKTGCPILVNTSFNLSWEPIVQTPEEAYHTFMQSEMDVLVLEDVVLLKDAQQLGFSTITAAAPASSVEPATPFADPITRDALVVDACRARNPRTGQTYPIEGGIPRLFVPTDAEHLDGHDVTDMVKQFYEETPFPNYEDVDTPRALLEKARAGLFARLLNDCIPYDARVVEVGCGTGQLTNFLSIAHRSVLGVDICLNSLGLAERFKSDHGLSRATFAQMNLFRPALKDGFFDVVISNGVLHHTSDCRMAFKRIGQLVRPGGYLVVGLYNSYSRSLHYARRSLFRWTGLKGRALDPHFADTGSDGRKAAWFRDQYCHPHETSHTIDEVLAWMDADGLEFVNSVPKPSVGTSLGERENLFEPHERGTAAGRVASQVAALANGYREGGFFIMIGRKPMEGTS